MEPRRYGGLSTFFRSDPRCSQDVICWPCPRQAPPWSAPARRPQPSAIRTSRRRAPSTPRAREACPIPVRRIQPSPSSFPRRNLRRPTDVGGLPLDWASFNNAPRRIQNGGWARQVTVDDFAISKEISGVNMRLTCRRHPRAALAPGGRMGDHDLRQLPRHRARRAGSSLCRRRQGRRPLVFPAGRAAFAAGPGSRRLRVRDLLRRRPRQRIQHAAGDRLVRAHAARGAGEELRRAGRQRSRRFRCTTSGSSRAPCPAISPPTAPPSQKHAEAPPYPFIFPLGGSTPIKESAAGTIRVADSTNFKVATSDRGGAGDRARRAASARCTGIRMPTSGSTTSRARRG